MSDRTTVWAKLPTSMLLKIIVRQLSSSWTWHSRTHRKWANREPQRMELYQCLSWGRRQRQLLWQISQQRLKSPANGPVMEGLERCIWHHMQLVSCVICYNLQVAMWRSSAHPDSDSQRRRRPPQRGGARKGNKSDLKVSVWPGAAFHQLCFCTDSSVQMIHSLWRAVLAEGQSRSCELITGWQNTEEVLTIQMACVKNST